MGSTDFGGRARESLQRSQKRRAIAARLRRRRLRVRGSTLSLLAVLLVTAVAGAGASLADNGAQAGAATAEVTLRKGDRGPAVAQVQRKLRTGADGVFGPMTHRALVRFQRRKGLTADGIVGPMTRRALRLRPFARSSVVHPRRRSRRGSAGSGSAVRLPQVLVRIARCESGGNPRAVSANGTYRGKYQFMRSTWRAWGGRTSDPIRASEAHQDRVALRLYRARGTSSWPSCAG